MYWKKTIQLKTKILIIICFLIGFYIFSQSSNKDNQPNRFDMKKSEYNLTHKIEFLKINADSEIFDVSSFKMDKKQITFQGVKRIGIHFKVKDETKVNKITYIYKLEGFDGDWINAGSQGTAYYTNLPPGIYKFHVRGSEVNGIYRENGANFTFHIKPFFYQTWWFLLLIVLGIIFFALRFFYRQLKKYSLRMQELEKLVTQRSIELEDSNKELLKLSIVTKQTDNAVVIMDKQGNIEWFNEGFTRMYGFTMEQLFAERGRNLVEVSSNLEIQEVFKEFLRDPKPTTYEVLFTSRSNKKKWVHTNLTPVFDDNGHLDKVVAIDTDIDQLKKSELKIKRQNVRIIRQSQELQEAFEIARKERELARAANEAKSEFLARMSHEIRTPMNGVIGFADMLMDTKLNKEQLDYIKTLRRSGEALINLLNDILDLSKIEAGELSIEPIEFDPEMTVFDVFEIIIPRTKGKAIEMLCKIGDDIPALVKGDAGRFRQVLINLLENAVKFTKSGEIELSLEIIEEQEDRFKFQVKVRDTGIGISPNKLKIIFDPFQQADGSTTREYGGTGLGLSISRNIAQHMQGELWAESEPGKGSTFYFTCCMDKSEKKIGKTSELGIKHLYHKTVLVVDDNINNLKILTHLLNRAKMKAVTLSKAEDVIPTIKNCFSKQIPIDVGIIDIHMPTMDGLTIAKQIRKLDPPYSKIPLLAYSSAIGYRAKDYRDSGFNGFLPKPVQGKKLLEVVAHLLLTQKLTDGQLINKIAPHDNAIITRHTVSEEAKHSVHILLAEDNPINQKLANFMLTKAGYSLTIANNGFEVIEVYSSDPGKYNLIFMDIQMPKMDGLEATKIIRQKGYKDIPIIAMTAQSMKGDREKCLNSGMNDYIAKPIKRDIVFSMVKRYCLDVLDRST